MPKLVSLLRAVNVGGNRVAMVRLREIYGSLGLQNPQTLLQSGNVVFETEETDRADIAGRIESSVEREFGFFSHVVLRDVKEMQSVVARNPFAGRADVTPDRLLVTFLKSDPGETARQAVRAIPVTPDELVIEGSELFIYYVEGVGKTKLSAAKLERTLGVPGTARNWNSVLRLLTMLEP